MFPASVHNTTIYINKISIDCGNQKKLYEATCTFKNRANNTINATVVIPVIVGKFSNKHQLINQFNRAIWLILHSV